jgi:hypothetical protein
MVHPEEPIPCPCCGFLTLAAIGNYEICPVCFWEDDGTRDLDQHSGPNHMTLQQGRENYQHIGACDPHMLKNVRPPHPSEHPTH